MPDKRSPIEQMLAPHGLAFVAIAKERKRQIELWGSDQNKHPILMTAILAEESGEVAKAAEIMFRSVFLAARVGEVAKAALERDYTAIREEAIQVAAVALAIIEGAKHMVG